MKELLEYILRSLVDTPEEIVIRERSSRYTVTYEISVNANETGKIIGRNGRVAKSIRDVMGVAATRQSKRVHIDIK